MHPLFVATAFQDQDAPRDELNRLNDAERRVLRLLAEGHTAKSIALALGSTAAAVNERLREARRKTGVGSSRELARMLRAQESRDEQMGVASGGGIAATPKDEVAAAPARRVGKGMLVMIAIGLSALLAAAAALQAPQGQHGAIVVDPLIGAIPSSEEAPDSMYRKLRAEPRDSAWAPSAEQVLRKRFSQIERVGRPPAELRVTCAATMCEVAGTIDAPDPKGKEYEDFNHPLNKAMRELQDLPLYNDLKTAGLERGASMFGSTAGKPQRASFIMYFKRIS